MKPYEMFAGKGGSVATLTPEAVGAARANAPQKPVDGGMPSGKKSYEIMPQWSAVSGGGKAMPTGGLLSLSATVGATGGVTQEGGVASIGMMSPFARPKPYEIMPSAKGCGCGGGCGPCGDSGGTKASANQLDPSILRAGMGTPISVGDVEFGLRRAETPTGVGGPSRCALAEAAAAELRGRAAALRRQANALYDRWDNCRNGRGLPQNSDICTVLLAAYSRALDENNLADIMAYGNAQTDLCNPLRNPTSVPSMHAGAVSRACQQFLPNPGEAIVDLLAAAAELERQADDILRACYENPVGDAGVGLGGWCGFRCRGEGVDEYNRCTEVCARDARNGVTGPLTWEACEQSCRRSRNRQRSNCEEDCNRAFARLYGWFSSWW